MTDKLLTEILSIEEVSKLIDTITPIAEHPIHLLDLITNTEAKVLAKIREVIEGVELTGDERENLPIHLATLKRDDARLKLALQNNPRNPMYESLKAPISAIAKESAKAMKQAILKAIGGRNGG